MRRISTYSQMTVTMMPKAARQAELAGSAVAHALLDLVEVEHERVRAHDDHERAHQQAERDAEDLDLAAQAERAVGRTEHHHERR